jgi:hypothetical protein
MDPYAKPKEHKVGTNRPKISHLPAKIDNGAGGSRATWTGGPGGRASGSERVNRTRKDREAEKQAVAAERRAIKKSARRHLKQELLSDLEQL